MGDFLLCNTASDCAIQRPGISMECFEEPSFAEVDNICDCSIFFGWTGENCDKASGVLIYNRIMSFFLALWAFINGILISRSMILNYWAEGVKLNFIFLTSINLLLTTLCMFTSQFIRFIGLFNPDTFQVNVYKILGDDFEQTDVNGSFLGRYAFILTALFGPLSFLFLLLSWNDVIKQVSKYHPFDVTINRKDYRRKVFLVSFVVAYTILVIIVLITKEIVFAIAIITLKAFLFTGFFCILARRFQQSLDKVHKSVSESNSHKFEVDLLNKVNRFVLYMGGATSVISFVFTASNILYLAFYEQSQRVTQPGEFHVILLFNDTRHIVIIAWVFIGCWYVNSVSVGAIIAEFHPNYCGWFKRWDAQNLLLIPEKNHSIVSSKISSYENGKRVVESENPTNLA